VRLRVGQGAPWDKADEEGVTMLALEEDKRLLEHAIEDGIVIPMRTVDEVSKVMMGNVSSNVIPHVANRIREG
jgi:hypothetical protein